MSEPQWLTTALGIIEGEGGDAGLVEAKKVAWCECARIATLNGEGLVVRWYDVATDNFEWAFGAGAWVRLIDTKTDKPFDDDPFKDRQTSVPLAEFIIYLHDWYFPRHKELTGASV